MNYYNEIDPGAAAWLRELIRAGLIPFGDVDTRSIEDVLPHDLAPYTQCHFFAGIAGWPLALSLAGWPSDRPIWTGSCPCQPFSVAGKGAGVDDERHLWPAFRWLIDQCRPATVIGEQVASRAGRDWLAGVFADVEAMGYARGGIDLCAAGVGAPHIRQRLFWVAHSGEQRRQQITRSAFGNETANGWESDGNHIVAGIGENFPGGVAHHHGKPGGQGCAVDDGRPPRNDAESWSGSRGDSSNGGVSDAAVAQLQGQPPTGDEREHGENDLVFRGWGDNWIPCADGKARRIEPGLSPLAHGIPARVVRLRGYGNAIVPQVAAEFIKACM